MLAREEYDMFTHSEEEASSSIDTLAILKRLEKQKELKKIHQILVHYKTTHIDLWEKNKYLFYAIGSTFGILGINAYVAFIKSNFLSNLPIATFVNELLSKYNNTLVKTINHTCGNLIPHQGTLFKSIFLSTSSRFCLDTIVSNSWPNSSNLTIPNQNFTCEDKFISPDAFYTCQNAFKFIKFEYDSAIHKIIMSIFVSFGLFLMLLLCIFGIENGLSYIENQNRLNKLPKEDQDAFFQVLGECNVEIVNDNNMKVTHAIDLLETTIRHIPKDKQLINGRRFNFLIGREDPNSDIPNQLPNDIAHKILYFSTLFSNPPVEMTEEECEKNYRKKTFFMSNR